MKKVRVIMIRRRVILNAAPTMLVLMISAIQQFAIGATIKTANFRQPMELLNSLEKRKSREFKLDWDTLFIHIISRFIQTRF